MRFCEFAKKVQEEAARLCGEAYEVGIQEVRKNNGVTRTGLFLRKEGETVGAVVYLDTYYRCWGRGEGEAPIGDVARLVCKAFSDSGREELVAREFRDFGSLRHRIVYRLVSRERNEELLKEVPWVPFCDLAVVFAVVLRDGAEGFLTFLIYHQHVELWGTDVETVRRAAKENTPRLLPCRFLSFEDILQRNPGFSWPEGGISGRAGKDGDPAGTSEEEPYYVLTNEKGVNGAAALLYDGVLREISDRFDRDLVLLPSSVHEVIVIPYKGGVRMEDLAAVVHMVNETEVSAEDILSDKVYRYRRETGTVTLASGSERGLGEMA